MEGTLAGGGPGGAGRDAGSASEEQGTAAAARRCAEAGGNGASDDQDVSARGGLERRPRGGHRDPDGVMARGGAGSARMPGDHKVSRPGACCLAGPTSSARRGPGAAAPGFEGSDHPLAEHVRGCAGVAGEDRAGEWRGPGGARPARRAGADPARSARRGVSVSSGVQGEVAGADEPAPAPPADRGRDVEQLQVDGPVGVLVRRRSYGVGPGCGEELETDLGHPEAGPRARGPGAGPAPGRRCRGPGRAGLGSGRERSVAASAAMGASDQVGGRVDVGWLPAPPGRVGEDLGAPPRIGEGGGADLDS